MQKQSDVDDNTRYDSGSRLELHRLGRLISSCHDIHRNTQLDLNNPSIAKPEGNEE